MSIPLLSTPAGLPVPHNDGTWHSAEVSRVIECIREYDRNLDVKYIPPGMRDPGDPAFAITERTKDGREVVAFYVNTEEEMNLSVLARIHAGDNAKHNVQNALEARQAAERHLRQKRYQDELAEANDKAWWLWNTHKNTVTMDGKKINR